MKNVREKIKKWWWYIKIQLHMIFLIILKAFHSFFNRLRKELVLFIPATVLVKQLLIEFEKFIQPFTECMPQIQLPNNELSIYVISFAICIILPSTVELFICDRFKKYPDMKIGTYYIMNFVYLVIVPYSLYLLPPLLSPLALFPYIILWYKTDRHLRQTQLNFRFNL